MSGLASTPVAIAPIGEYALPASHQVKLVMDAYGSGEPKVALSSVRARILCYTCH